ncbi:MAG: 1-acylglycerol-3-phosphate O-acyltransferase [Alistipes sp.]|nr:1-acylglycerol-3-phosphate O-acyltransferase [Alistipes sp.]
MLSLLYYITVTIICFVLYLLSWIAFFICYPFDKRRVVVHFISKLITDTVLGIFGREVIGGENIDPKQPYVIVINHTSMMDIMSIYPLPLVFKWVSKREVYRIPMVGRLLFMHGDIVINRASTKEAMQLVHTRGMEWLKKGASVSIFPEGTRSKDGEIHNFKAGAFILAKDAEVPILPVVLAGTNNMVRNRIFMNWKNRIRIKVLPPVTKEEVVARPIKEVMTEVRESMVEALAELRAEEKK